MSFRDDYIIDRVSRDVAMDIVVRNHYLHRIAPCSVAFGLWKGHTFGAPVGVIVYGVGPSTTMRSGVCGKDEAGNVYELTRLWVDDDVPRNGESYLIGNTIKKLDKEIIISYADSSAGHVGYVYQATNFFYCGLSAKFRDPKVRGMEHLHHATYARGMTMAQVRKKYGEDNVYYVDRPRKHRYVFFNAKRKRRSELIGKLRWDVLPYPKMPLCHEI